MRVLCRKMSTGNTKKKTRLKNNLNTQRKHGQTFLIKGDKAIDFYNAILYNQHKQKLLTYFDYQH